MNIFVLKLSKNKTFSTTEHGTPTSVAFGNVDLSQAVVSFDTGETVLYDLNTEQSIMVLETQTKDGEQDELNQLVNPVYSVDPWKGTDF